MFLFVTSLICVLASTFAITINAPTNKDQTKSASSQDKRSLLIGDLSYSYSATDIGSEEGGHVKTITVIKNIGAPTFKKSPYHPYDEWDENSKNRFNFVFKLPDFPDTGTFFHKEKPKKVIPTKQPTDRQTPVFEIDNQPDDPRDNQPNVDTNNNENVPQVYDINQSENDPEPLPDPMTLSNGSKDNPVESPVNTEASDEVEYIQTDGEQSKAMMPKVEMFHNKKEPSNGYSGSNGYRISNVHKKTEQKRAQSQRQSTEFLEDFSDYSMHNVKHLVDPMKVKDSLLKYTQNQSNLDLKKLTTMDSTIRNQKYDSYGNVIGKSQSLLDATKSSSYNINPQSNQQSKRPYVSPSVKQPYRSSSPSPSNLKVDYPTTSSDGIIFFSTTQKAYVAPAKHKSSKNISPKPEHYVVKTFTESTQPKYSQQINGNHEQIFQHEFQPQAERYQQIHKEEDKKPMQQFQSYSIRNPLTTSLPIQHNHQESHKPKMQSYIAVPLDAQSSKHPLNMPKRYVRHHIVFDSKPPHAFMEAPFKPVKAVLIG